MKSFGIYLAALFAGAALATGCYEDKGNYDYTTTGDDIVVYRPGYDEVGPPELELRRGDRHRARLQDRSRPGVGRQPALRWEHRRGDGLHGGRILSIDPLSVGRHSGSFTVLDADRQVRYSTIFTLTVTSSFAEGWFILSDDGGKSLLSYVNLVDASTPGELVRDVYGEVNEGSSVPIRAGSGWWLTTARTSPMNGRSCNAAEASASIRPR